MGTTKIHYKVPEGNISGTEKWVGNPLQFFPVQSQSWHSVNSSTSLSMFLSSCYIRPHVPKKRTWGVKNLSSKKFNNLTCKKRKTISCKTDKNLSCKTDKNLSCKKGRNIYCKRDKNFSCKRSKPLSSKKRKTALVKEARTSLVKKTSPSVLTASSLLLLSLRNTKYKESHSLVKNAKPPL